MGDLNDRFSQLPEDIITNILSRITIEEAGRTSILSKQWRYYWTQVDSLHFPYQSCCSNFIPSVVNNFIAHEQPSNLLNLFVGLNCPDCNQLKFKIYYQTPYLETDTALETHVLNSLTVLKLYKVQLKDSDDTLFSNCSNLEKLVMFNCIGRETYSISCPRLISLQIVDKYPGKRFMISSPRLQFCRLDIVNPERLMNRYAPFNTDIHIASMCECFDNHFTCQCYYMTIHYGEWRQDSFSDSSDSDNESDNEFWDCKVRPDRYYVKLRYTDPDQVLKLVREVMCGVRLRCGSGSLWLSSVGGFKRLLLNDEGGSEHYYTGLRSLYALTSWKEEDLEAFTAEEDYQEDLLNSVDDLEVSIDMEAEELEIVLQRFKV